MKILAIEPGFRFTGHQVARILSRIAEHRGYLKMIRVDNGPEFAGKALDQWAYLIKVELDFSRPGKPTDIAFIEAFNGRLRAECLDQHWFVSLEDAKEKLGAWRIEYNEMRPHGSLGDLALASSHVQAGVPWPGRAKDISHCGWYKGGERFKSTEYSHSTWYQGLGQVTIPAGICVQLPLCTEMACACDGLVLPAVDATLFMALAFPGDGCGSAHGS